MIAHTKLAAFAASVGRRKMDQDHDAGKDAAPNTSWA
jgi:hypothetical protein